MDKFFTPVLRLACCVLFTVQIVSAQNGIDSCENNLEVSYVPIPSDVYEANESITSAGSVPQGNSVMFDAAKEIFLEPNFEVQLGGDFEAVTADGCGGLSAACDSIGHEYYECITGITTGGGSTWYANRTLPAVASGDTITTESGLITAVATAGTYFIKGRINMDGSNNIRPVDNVTLVGVHGDPSSSLESELYWTSNNIPNETNINTKALFNWTGDGGKLYGIKIAGQDTTVTGTAQGQRAINARGDTLWINNCEIAYFDRGGVDIQSDGSVLVDSFSYYHNIWVYQILGAQADTYFDVFQSKFEFDWHAVALTNHTDWKGYKLHGCHIYKNTRVDTSIWGQFGYGGRIFVDVHTGVPDGQATFNIQYNTFEKGPVNADLDPWENPPSTPEVYDMWIRNEQNPLAEIKDLIFKYNYTNRAYNATYGHSVRIDAGITGTLDTTRNYVFQN